jgi:acetyl esterase/lipase
MKVSALFAFLALCSIAALADNAPAPTAAATPAQKPRPFTYPPSLPDTTVETYKEVDHTALNVWIFPPGGKITPGAKLPAIVFFFGGGWSNGSPAQFERQSRHLAERGMVAMVADYRVATRHHVKPATCVADAKSCIRWIRKNADRLGIDPNRLVAAGGSAGGHLAAATEALPGLDESGEDTSISAVPNAAILFNPVVVFGTFPGLEEPNFSKNFTAEKLGCEPEAISPLHHVTEHLPPTLILHGRADTTVPYATVEAFATEMQKKGNRCELVGYEGQGHGFFNNAKYAETLAEADKFLVSLGYLPPEKAKP